VRNGWIRLWTAEQAIFFFPRLRRAPGGTACWKGRANEGDKAATSRHTREGGKRRLGGSVSEGCELGRRKKQGAVWN